jgi:hypothetical protein
MKKVIITTVFTMLVFASFAQREERLQEREETSAVPYESKLHLGIGAGLDYGGLGAKVEYLPVKYLGVFGGVGYNFLSLGINAGIQGRPLPDAKVQPIALLMYGYNGVINIKGYGGTTKTYYGLSAGLGGELKVGRRHNRLYIAVLYPFRSKEFKDDYDEIKRAPYIKLQSELLPVTFSFGFNWAL